MFKINIFILTTVALTLSGCFAKLHTLPEFPTKENKSSVFQKLDDPSDTLVGIAVSGGGSRAATFAAGVLEELAKLQVIDDGKNQKPSGNSNAYVQRFWRKLSNRVLCFK